MYRSTRFLLVTLLFVWTAALRAQEPLPGQPLDTIAVDTTGHVPIDDSSAQTLLEQLGPGWGYNFDSLGISLARWSQSPLVSLDTIGLSVQGRPIIEMRLAAREDSTPRPTVYIHARTHPGEVQAFRVTEQMIEQLLRFDPVSRALLERTVLRIIPMYNPDGVELGFPRENANGIDLEREWDKNPMQPEPAALKQRFLDLMAGTQPIAVALNMHSTLDCERYFYYHAASGTSQEFAQLEREFIEGVRAYFPDGIQPWSRSISWQDERPTHFPESFWWETHGAAVMALTYEDMNCDAAGKYDSTASALLQGIAAYMNISASVRRGDAAADAGFAVEGPVPQPAREYAEIGYTLPHSGHVTVEILDALGRTIAMEDRGGADAGHYVFRWITRTLSPGVYFFTIRWDDSARTVRVVVGGSR